MLVGKSDGIRMHCNEAIIKLFCLWGGDNALEKTQDIINEVAVQVLWTLKFVIEKWVFLCSIISAILFLYVFLGLFAYVFY